MIKTHGLPPAGRLGIDYGRSRRAKASSNRAIPSGKARGSEGREWDEGVNGERRWERRVEVAGEDATS